MKPADRTLLNITEFKGAHTNSPRGLVPAPDLLLNVNLDRTGGYTPMYARSRRLENVSAAIPAGVGDNLFFQLAGTYDGGTPLLKYFDGSTGTVTTLTGSVTNYTGVNLMPDLALLDDGNLWLTPTYSQSGALMPGTVSDTGTPDLKWAYVDRTAFPNEPGFSGTVAPYEVAIEWIPTKEHPFRGVTVFHVGMGYGAPPARFWFSLTSNPAFTTPPRYNVYVRSGTRPYEFLGSNYTVNTNGVIAGVGQVKHDQPYIAVSPAQPGDNTELLSGIGLKFSLTNNTATTYHQGRVYFAPTSVTYQRVNTSPTEAAVEGITTITSTVPNRVYFSEVTASAREALPEFSLLNYVDVPFRVSRKVVALASVGAYLYIFGDREVFMMVGDPSTDARLESIGDSIGAISGQSVRQLSGVVYWQSDSGVLAAHGADVQEVGEPVRDQLLSLGLNVTATVDFKREQYILTDSVTILVYHAREGGWTTRQVEGPTTPTLLYGGGTPYMLSGTTLYSIGGEAGLDGTPPRLPMQVRFPYYELGDWRARKSFQGIAFGMDLATSNAVIVNETTVDGLLSQQSDTRQTVTAGSVGAVKLHTARDGQYMSGAGVSIDVTITCQDSRAIMRPPLTVYGAMTGDEMWVDNGD